jgi:sensor histidine kinase YesM
MFNKIANWYNTIDEEQMAVLLDPSLADAAPAGWRRATTRTIAKLTAIERAQLHAFSIKYRGRQAVFAVLKLLLALSVLGTVLYYVFPLKLSLLATIVATVSIGILLLFILCGIWFNYRQLAQTRLKYFLGFAIKMLLAIGALTLAIAFIKGRPVLDVFTAEAPRILRIAFVVCGVYAIMVLVVAALRNREYESTLAHLESEAERERLARQLSESQLRLLRAQVEPHFLFNTLGAVQQLAEQDAPRAAELTANLITFLRASTTEMRADSITLGEEFSLTRAYLDVMKARLGQRLQFTMALPAELAAIKVPGMMLLTLAENAIKHAVEPALQGASISIGADADAGELRVWVRDTGAGLPDTPQPGLGLGNIKERLRLMYAGAASLLLEEVAEGGVHAQLRMPLAAKEAA